ncbi:MAG: GNAT family N-acetyltransferase [Gammaproteobacteria bacterium]|nr:MAG: GNAT family N-acetyltransferase [Gammaproteobacteria bacterium]
MIGCLFSILAGYRVAYVKSSNDILAVAGLSTGVKLAWGKSICFDDQVTNSRHRSTGDGKSFIDWFNADALEKGCEQIHLDSVVPRFPAHRFYLREGFVVASHHFSISAVNDG